MGAIVVNRLSVAEVADILALIDTATVADGVPPLGESSLLRLRDQDLPHGAGGFALVRDGAALAGAGVLDGDTAEFVVRPDLRRRGHGRALAVALRELAAGPLKVWAHGETPGAVALARSLGWRRFRALWRMRRPLEAPLPEVAWPVGVRLRTFEVGADEDAWVRVNARAFADHPEQGRWTRTDLERREREPWFSPAGFFLAERDGVLIGFHWTKIHEDGIGEVYVVGVDPSAQRLGLGRALTLTGLHHLKAVGRPAVILYVDEANTRATGLYAALGFERAATDAMYDTDDRIVPPRSSGHLA